MRGGCVCGPRSKLTDNIDGNGTVYSTDMSMIRSLCLLLNYSYVDGGQRNQYFRTVMVQDTTLPILNLLWRQRFPLASMASIYRSMGGGLRCCR